MERFWLWLRRNLDTEQIMRVAREADHNTALVLAELVAIRAAVGDMRANLDMPPMVNMEDIESNRAPSGDPTGL